MRQHVTRKRLILGIGTPIALGALTLSGCGDFRAEHQGVQAGRAICDVADADNLDDAQRQVDQAQRQIDDLRRIVGRPVDQDVDDIEQNLSDLVEHAADGDDALVDQDVAAIQRNVSQVSSTLTGKAQAAYDGVQEGLAECDYS